VIDRYAALDSALNRLTRTMLNVRANARRKSTEPVATPSAAPLPIENIETTLHQRFDVVMPEDDDLAHESPLSSVTNSAIHMAPPSSAKARSAEPLTEIVAASAIGSDATAVATPLGSSTSAVREAASRAAADERRPYQLLFSELRRRRRRV
jgi:hypothetical protein